MRPGPVFVRSTPSGYHDESEAIAAVLRIAAGATSSALRSYHASHDEQTEGYALGLLASYLDTACAAHGDAARAFWSAYAAGRAMRADHDSAEAWGQPMDVDAAPVHAFDVWRASLGGGLPPVLVSMAWHGFSDGWGPSPEQVRPVRAPHGRCPSCGERALELWPVDAMHLCDTCAHAWAEGSEK